MPRPFKTVTDMEIDEVSLVDRPANPHARIAFAKRAPQEEAVPDEIYDEDGNALDLDDLEVGEVVFDEDGNAFQVEEDDGEADDEYDYDESDEGEYATIGKAGAHSVVRASEWLPGEAMSAAEKAKIRVGTTARHAFRREGGRHRAGPGPTSTWLPGEPGGGATLRRGMKTRAHFARNRGRYLAGGTIAAAGGAGYAGAGLNKRFADEIREELAKAVDDNERDMIVSKAFGQIDDLAARLYESELIQKSERDLRLTREYISKAAEYNVPVDPEELGPVLFELAEAQMAGDLPPGTCEVIHKALATAGSILYEELGYDGSADNLDPMDQIDAYLDDQIAKRGGDRLSKADAVVEFFANNPEAYDEYIASQNAR